MLKLQLNYTGLELENFEESEIGFFQNITKKQQ
jgi:hypothetical protein